MTRLLARRRGLRRRPRLVRRVRRHRRGQAGPQAGRPLLRRGLRHADLGGHRPPGTHRRRQGPGRTVGADHRCLRAASAATRCSSPRSSGAEVTGVCSSAKARLRPRPRRPPRHRLHPRRLGRRHTPLRPRSSTSPATRPCAGCDVPSPRAGRLSSSAARAAAPSPGCADSSRGALLSPFIGQRLVLLLARERADRLRAARPAHRSRPADVRPGPQLPARAGSRRHAATWNGADPRQGRHHDVTAHLVC